MLNIVIPIGSSRLADDNDKFQYPLPLVEIFGKALIEYSLEKLLMIRGEVKFTFILKDEDCSKYHFDNSLKLLVPGCSIIRLKGQTQGAVCSVLMAIDTIEADSELLIVNYDQYIEYDLNTAIDHFRKDGTHAGLVTFKSVHPRWSYARVVGTEVLQTAEKNPISNHAIAGIYYFKSTRDFIQGAFNVIRYNDTYNDSFYTSAVFNQLILNSRKVENYSIPEEKYYSFYSSQKVKEFESYLSRKANGKV